MTDPVKTDLASLTGGTAIVPLNTLALIAVRGDDAQSFLQGQLSNDVDALCRRADAAPDRACRGQLNAYCNPKGRALAVIRLLRLAGGFWMLAPAGLADGLVKRLKMYVLRARVEVELKPEMALFGLINGGVGEGVEKGPEKGPEKGIKKGVENVYETGSEKDAKKAIHRIPLDGVVPRHILIAEQPAMDALVRASGHEPRPDDRLWRLADVLSGIPQVYPQTVEAFIPQMINLDLVDGLSFTKGCYPGQEIIARLRYLGKVKQRMLAGAVSGVENLAPGDPVYAARRPDQKAGLVVDAAPTGAGEYTLSATAPTAQLEQGTLRVGSPDGPVLKRIALPYPVPAETSR